MRDIGILVRPLNQAAGTEIATEAAHTVVVSRTVLPNARIVSLSDRAAQTSVLSVARQTR
jgi:hypothetical protein